jgi:hypothetical protein
MKKRISLSHFQQPAYTDMITHSAASRIPVGQMHRMLQDDFGHLTHGQMRVIGRLIRRVAESMGFRLVRDNVPFKLPGCQFSSGAIYA